MKYKECEFCEGKGYTHACYDEVQSREECFECIGCGYIYEEDEESEEE